MALYDLIFKRTEPQSRQPSSGQADFEKPTIFQELTGSGKAMRELSQQKKRVKDSYMSQLKSNYKDKHTRQKDFKESLDDRRKYLFGHQAGLWDLTKRAPTKEELRDPNIKNVAEKFDKIEKQMTESFAKSEQTRLNGLKKDFHDQLKQTSRDFRERGIRGEQGAPRPRSFAQHIFGASRSGKT